MAKYDSYSLAELKAAMRHAYAHLQELESTWAAYRNGAEVLARAAETLSSVTASAQGAWQGNAAEAAGQALRGVSGYSEQSHAASRHLAAATRGLARSTEHHHDQVDGIPEIDTSYGASMSASGMNPFVAVPEHADRVNRAATHQRQAAAQARALDDASQQHEQDMKAADWPRSFRRSHGAPPRTLPARPARGTGPGNPPTNGPTPTRPTPLPAPVPGPSTSDPGGGVVTPQYTGAPVIPAAGGVSVSGAGAGLVASGSGGLSAGLAADGALGLGAGALASGGLATGLGAELESGRLGRPVTGRGPEGRFGAVEENPSALRAARGAGAFGEAAGERGMLGPPMGAGAGRRRGDDEEHARPKYLEEPEETWVLAEGGVPPVLGEDG